MARSGQPHKPTGETGAKRSETKGRSLTVLYSADPRMRDRIIPIGDKLVVGRQAVEGVGLAVDDRLLSRTHASISPSGKSGLYELVDHQSRNGSFVEGARVQRAQIADGAIIRLGVTVFELTRDDPENAPAEANLGEREAFLGRSIAFRDARALLDAAASDDSPVVIVGEAGVGKSLAAAYVHRQSGRRGPFTVVSCGSGGTRLTERDLLGGVAADGRTIEGYCKAAEGGTLVLDEVDLLAPGLQRTLLGVLTEKKHTPVGGGEEQPFTARIIASTGANLEAAVQAGVFERALHAQLAGHLVEIPSLRTRRSDVPLLARHFLRIEEPQKSFEWSATFLEKLLLYDWPLNVRELRTVMRRLTMVEDGSTTLRSAHLPKEIRKRVTMPSEDALRASAITVHVAPSREELHRMLQRFDGDVERLAEHYAKDRRHIYRWLTRHDLSVSDYRK
jgi:DNA-binding NtrC family response regulator